MLEKLNFPKVSVLIPVYNVEKYVARCILSILNQTMQEGVEVIIVNDCTPDHSMEIIRELLRTHLKENGMTVRIVEHVANRGLAAARNTAMECAMGDYIIHVDSDDYVEPDMLEKMYTRAVEADADIVIADYYKNRKDREIYCKNNVPEDKDILYGRVIRHQDVVLWNKLIKRNIYLNNNISWIDGLDYGEDYIVSLSIFFHAKKVVYLPCALYHYVYNEQSICRTTYNSKKQQNDMELLDYAKHFLIERNIFVKYEYDFYYEVLRIKFRLLKNNVDNNLDKYIKLYPEANKYRYRFFFVIGMGGRINKVMYFFALNNRKLLYGFFIG